MRDELAHANTELDRAYEEPQSLNEELETEPMLRRVPGDATGDGATPAPVGHVTAVNRRGKTVELRITASPMRTEEGGISGVTLVIGHQLP